MIDHYTKSELCFKLNCHGETLDNLARMGPGFDIKKITRGTMNGYVIRKDKLYAWADAVMGDDELHRQVLKHAPSLRFISVQTDRKKWVSDMEDIRRLRKPHLQRVYGRGIEDGKNKEVKCDGAERADELVRSI